MIVYFLTKRKAGRVVCLGAVLVCLGYGYYVHSRVVSDQMTTAQVVTGGVPAALGVQVATSGSEVSAGQGSLVVPEDSAFVASKKGTYFYPISCSRAKSLSSKNTLYFKDISAAEAAGFKAFSGC